jgi:hypothetical protein
MTSGTKDLQTPKFNATTNVEIIEKLAKQEHTAGFAARGRSGSRRQTSP